jgi:DNA-binding SARP family transcriptional activator
MARSLHGLGHVAAVRGDHAAAQGALAAALTEAQAAGEREVIVGILHSQASVATMQGDYTAVRALAEEGIALAVAGGDSRGEALALLQLAGAELIAGLNPAAARHLIRSLELARELDIPLLLSTALGTLGSLSFNTGDFDEASRHYGESLTVARTMGDRRLEMITLFNLAEVARVGGELPRSRGILGEAGAIARRLGDRRAMAMMNETLADIAMDLADLDGSAALLAQSLVVRRDIGDRRGVASALDSIARLVEHRGDVDEPVRLVAAATSMYEAIGAARPADAAAWAEDVVARVDADRVAPLLAEGRGWSTETAVERALRLVDARPLELPPVPPAAESASDADAAVAAAVAVDVLGGFAVRRNGEPVPTNAWQSKKARELLKLLVVRRGQPVPREQLMEWLWPDGEPAASANRLRVALSVLRSVLDPEKAHATNHYVRSEGGAVRLDLDHVDVDVERFLDAVGASDHAIAEVRYRGDVLPEDIYEDWAVPFREEARVAYVSVATTLLRKAVARGDAASAARLSVRLLERDPYDEASHVELVRALSSLGRHGDARRAHDAYAERMGEIGVAVAGLATIVGPGGDGGAMVEKRS